MSSPFKYTAVGSEEVYSCLDETGGIAALSSWSETLYATILKTRKNVLLHISDVLSPDPVPFPKREHSVPPLLIPNVSFVYSLLIISISFYFRLVLPQIQECLAPLLIVLMLLK